MLASYVAGAWYVAPEEGTAINDAATGDEHDPAGHCVRAMHQVVARDSTHEGGEEGGPVRSRLRGPGLWLQNGPCGHGPERVDVADSHCSSTALEVGRV
jgi:hypothetical protein